MSHSPEDSDPQAMQQADGAYEPARCPACDSVVNHADERCLMCGAELEPAAPEAQEAPEVLAEEPAVTGAAEDMDETVPDHETTGPEETSDSQTQQVFQSTMVERQSPLTLWLTAAFTIAIVMALALVYMLMAAQFERFFDPLIVMLAVPMALSSSSTSTTFWCRKPSI